jgi:excisionase family DNA binding protein
MNSLMTAKQVAEMLTVQPSTVYEWARMNYIPHVKLAPGAVRFEREKIEEWVRRKRESGRLMRVPE